MIRILESSQGQKYVVDDQFPERLEDYVTHFTVLEDDIYVEGNLTDLLDFLTDEGFI